MEGMFLLRRPPYVVEYVPSVFVKKKDMVHAVQQRNNNSHDFMMPDTGKTLAVPGGSSYVARSLNIYI